MNIYENFNSEIPPTSERINKIILAMGINNQGEVENENGLLGKVNNFIEILRNRDTSSINIENAIQQLPEAYKNIQLLKLCKALKRILEKDDSEFETVRPGYATLTVESVREKELKNTVINNINTVEDRAKFINPKFVNGLNLNSDTIKQMWINFINEFNDLIVNGLKIKDINNLTLNWTSANGSDISFTKNITTSAPTPAPRVPENASTVIGSGRAIYSKKAGSAYGLYDESNENLDKTFSNVIEYTMGDGIEGESSISYRGDVYPGGTEIASAEGIRPEKRAFHGCRIHVDSPGECPEAQTWTCDRSYRPADADGNTTYDGNATQCIKCENATEEGNPPVLNTEWANIKNNLLPSASTNWFESSNNPYANLTENSDQMLNKRAALANSCSYECIDPYISNYGTSAEKEQELQKGLSGITWGPKSCQGPIKSVCRNDNDCQDSLVCVKESENSETGKCYNQCTNPNEQVSTSGINEGKCAKKIGVSCEVDNDCASNKCWTRVDSENIVLPKQTDNNACLKINDQPVDTKCEYEGQSCVINNNAYCCRKYENVMTNGIHYSGGNKVPFPNCNENGLCWDAPRSVTRPETDGLCRDSEKMPNFEGRVCVQSDNCGTSKSISNRNDESLGKCVNNVGTDGCNTDLDCQSFFDKNNVDYLAPKCVNNKCVNSVCPSTHELGEDGFCKIKRGEICDVTKQDSSDQNNVRNQTICKSGTSCTLYNGEKWHIDDLKKYRCADNCSSDEIISDRNGTRFTCVNKREVCSNKGTAIAHNENKQYKYPLGIQCECDNDDVYSGPYGDGICDNSNTGKRMPNFSPEDGQFNYIGKPLPEAPIDLKNQMKYSVVPINPNENESNPDALCNKVGDIRHNAGDSETDMIGHYHEYDEGGRLNIQYLDNESKYSDILSSMKSNDANWFFSPGIEGNTYSSKGSMHFKNKKEIVKGKALSDFDISSFELCERSDVNLSNKSNSVYFRRYYKPNTIIKKSNLYSKESINRIDNYESDLVNSLNNANYRWGPFENRENNTENIYFYPGTGMINSDSKDELNLPDKVVDSATITQTNNNFNVSLSTKETIEPKIKFNAFGETLFDNKENSNFTCKNDPCLTENVACSPYAYCCGVTEYNGQAIDTEEKCKNLFKLQTDFECAPKLTNEEKSYLNSSNPTWNKIYIKTGPNNIKLLKNGQLLKEEGFFEDESYHTTDVFCYNSSGNKINKSDPNSLPVKDIPPFFVGSSSKVRNPYVPNFYSVSNTYHISNDNKLYKRDRTEIIGDILPITQSKSENKMIHKALIDSFNYSRPLTTGDTSGNNKDLYPKVENLPQKYSTNYFKNSRNQIINYLGIYAGKDSNTGRKKIWVYNPTSSSRSSDDGLFEKIFFESGTTTISPSQDADNPRSGKSYRILYPNKAYFDLVGLPPRYLKISDVGEWKDIPGSNGNKIFVFYGKCHSDNHPDLYEWVLNSKMQNNGICVPKKDTHSISSGYCSVNQNRLVQFKNINYDQFKYDITEIENLQPSPIYTNNYKNVIIRGETESENEPDDSNPNKLYITRSASSHGHNWAPEKGYLTSNTGWHSNCSSCPRFKRINYERGTIPGPYPSGNAEEFGKYFMVLSKPCKIGGVLVYGRPDTPRTGYHKIKIKIFEGDTDSSKLLYSSGTREETITYLNDNCNLKEDGHVILDKFYQGKRIEIEFIERNRVDGNNCADNQNNASSLSIVGARIGFLELDESNLAYDTEYLNHVSDHDSNVNESATDKIFKRRCPPNTQFIASKKVRGKGEIAMCRVLGENYGPLVYDPNRLEYSTRSECESNNGEIIDALQSDSEKINENLYIRLDKNITSDSYSKKEDNLSRYNTNKNQVDFNWVKNWKNEISNNEQSFLNRSSPCKDDENYIGNIEYKFSNVGDMLEDSDGKCLKQFPEIENNNFDCSNFINEKLTENRSDGRNDRLDKLNRKYRIYNVPRSNKLPSSTASYSNRHVNYEISRDNNTQSFCFRSYPSRGNENYLVFDLGKECLFYGVAIQQRNRSAVGPKNIKIETSIDNITFTERDNPTKKQPNSISDSNKTYYDINYNGLEKIIGGSNSYNNTNPGERRRNLVLSQEIEVSVNNVDNDNIALVELFEPVNARYVKVTLETMNRTTHPCFRVGMLLSTQCCNNFSGRHYCAERALQQNPIRRRDSNQANSSRTSYGEGTYYGYICEKKEYKNYKNSKLNPNRNKISNDLVLCSTPNIGNKYSSIIPSKDCEEGTKIGTANDILFCKKSYSDLDSLTGNKAHYFRRGDTCPTLEGSSESMPVAKNKLHDNEYALCEVDNLRDNYHVIQADQFAVKWRKNNTGIPGKACLSHEKNVGTAGEHDLCAVYDPSAVGEFDGICGENKKYFTGLILNENSLDDKQKSDKIINEKYPGNVYSTEYRIKPTKEDNTLQNPFNPDISCEKRSIINSNIILDTSLYDSANPEHSPNSSVGTNALLDKYIVGKAKSISASGRNCPDLKRVFNDYKNDNGDVKYPVKNEFAEVDSNVLTSLENKERSVSKINSVCTSDYGIHDGWPGMEVYQTNSGVVNALQIPNNNDYIHNEQLYGYISRGTESNATPRGMDIATYLGTSEYSSHSVCQNRANTNKCRTDNLYNGDPNYSGTYRGGLYFHYVPDTTSSASNKALDPSTGYRCKNCKYSLEYKSNWSNS